MTPTPVPVVPEEPSAERLWDQLMSLAEMVEPGQPGWTRRVFSPAYRESRTWVSSLMAEAGLQVETDAAGNLVGRMAGRERAAPALAVGSHTDTVPGGGRFDGTLGVLAAIEVARLLRDAGQPLRHPLWVVDFLGEEPNRFGVSCLGSRALSGHLEPTHLELSDGSGSTLGDALRESGQDPERMLRARWHPGDLHAFLELHIEQSGHLDRAGRALGVVTAIAGINRARLQIQGQADHAGTTPIAARRDALQAAARMIQGVEEIAVREEPRSGVATVGRISVEPNTTNVVPARAVLDLEVRSVDTRWLESRSRWVAQMVDRVAAERRVEAHLEWVSSQPPVPCHPVMRELLTGAVRGLGEEPLEVPSGASHDAAHLAAICSMGMLFAPSLGGRSHCPEEWTEQAQVGVAAGGLLRAVLAVDGADL